MSTRHSFGIYWPSHLAADEWGARMRYNHAYARARTPNHSQFSNCKLLRSVYHCHSVCRFVTSTVSDKQAVRGSCTRQMCIDKCRFTIHKNKNCMHISAIDRSFVRSVAHTHTLTRRIQHNKIYALWINLLTYLSPCMPQLSRVRACVWESVVPREDGTQWSDGAEDELREWERGSESKDRMIFMWILLFLLLLQLLLLK